MTRSYDIDRVLDDWLSDGPSRLPDRVVASITADIEHAAPTRRWQLPWRNHVYRSYFALASAAVIVVVAASLALGLLANLPGVGGSSPSPAPPTSPWTAPPPTLGLGVLGPDRQLARTSDGTRLLVQRDGKNLFIVNADGSEALVAEVMVGIQGADFSPDGSRVVFADQTALSDCEDGVLFAADADGGPAELLFRSPRNKRIEHPAFSPDGTQVAFTDGNCDSDHIVWVVNADGTDAHQIVGGENHTVLGTTHVHQLYWAADGDRIALLTDQGYFSFAADGSEIR